jgi:RNA polymerase sigma-70 factor (ECF subfamily)
MSDRQPGQLPEEPPDEALVRASLQGDEHACERLVRRYLKKAMAVALTYVDTLEDAEDIVQDTFRRVFQNLRRFDDTRPFQPWLFTILRNTARSAQQRTRLRKHETLLPSHPGSHAGPLEEAGRTELRERIEDAVRRLPPMQRACFRLCLVEGFSSAEAAMAVGVAESTVRVHLFKARHALRGLLDRGSSQREEA